MFKHLWTSFGFELLRQKYHVIWRERDGCGKQNTDRQDPPLLQNSHILTLALLRSEQT
jgi:hypothetical protein